MKSSRLLPALVAMVASAVLVGCSSGGSSEATSGTLDQAGACAAWGEFLASPVSAIPNPPTAMESEQFSTLATAYQGMSDELTPLAESLGEDVDPALRDQLTKAAATSGQIASLSATTAESLANEDVEAIIPVMDEFSVQIATITDLCTS